MPVTVFNDQFILHLTLITKSYERVIGMPTNGRDVLFLTKENVGSLRPNNNFVFCFVLKINLFNSLFLFF